MIRAISITCSAALVQDTLSSRYRGLQDLKTCNVRPSDVCVPKGGAIDLFWINTIGKNACHKEKPVYFSRYKDGIDNLLTKKCLYMLTLSSSGNELTQREYCGRLLVTGEPALRTGLSFVLPRGSNMTSHLSEKTVFLTDAGVLPTPERYLRATGKCPEQNLTLNVEKLRFFFYMAFSACLFIFLEMILDSQQPPSLEASKLENGSGS
ncbi:unnamed protein product [Chondrus crispus]|uniref:Uncharacterized protein n=1 Tax=Chondrus crispus TaxID=2769 RepID=R7Q540_CHOCR|nr:unnamed protein product [Chondrus crispus]CDF33667.1 unnamed protein product [Chondrus crispus]|eukprot:XP_005713486.1 unnamed protein product [Chondrus crispus]